MRLVILSASKISAESCVKYYEEETTSSEFRFDFICRRSILYRTYDNDLNPNENEVYSIIIYNSQLNPFLNP